MKKGLNIGIEESLLERIKIYAKQHHVSLSTLTQSFYEQLLDKENKPDSIFEFLKKMGRGNYSKDFDFRKGYYEHHRY